MSDQPIDPLAGLAALSRHLDVETYKLRDAEQRATNKRHAYRVAKAKADLELAELRLAADLAEADLRALRTGIDAAATRIRVGHRIAEESGNAKRFDPLMPTTWESRR
jgi:hypothetical protein